MIDIKKKLNNKDIYLDHAETIEEYVEQLFIMQDQFYYKNVSYEIICWDDKKWAFQINAYQHYGKSSTEVFFEGTKEGFIKALETLTLHDGTLYYDALTKPGYDKFFCYNPNIQFKY